jgi:Protein of unknown function (DUF3575)
MKKILHLTAGILFFTFTAFSQSTKRQSTDHSQILKLGVNTYFSPDEFPFSISWEKKVGTNESIQIGFLPRIRSYNNEKTSGVGFNLGYRKYISKKRTGINGLFISPIAKIGFLKTKDTYTNFFGGNPPQTYTTTYNDNITQFSAGFVFGHNWVFKSGFAFEVSAGMAYFNSNDKSTNTTSGTTNKNNYKESGIMPQAQLSIGYAF